VGISATRNRPLGQGHISDELATVFRWVAVLSGGLSVLAFLVLAFYEGAPSSSQFNRWEEPAQLSILAAVVIGYLVALRWEGLGGGIMVVGAIGLGVLASVEFHPFESLFAALAFFVPGALFVLRWQRTRPLWLVATLTAAMAALLAGGAYASDYVYDYYFGPTHPASALERRPVDLVEWVWAGAVSSSTVTVNAKLADSGHEARLAVSESADLSDPVHSPFMVAPPESEGIVALLVGGLRPDTQYYYAVETKGRLDLERRGTFRTFPEGQSSFTFAFSGCARVGSNGSVFDAIRSHNPLFFLITGDFHYSNITENDLDALLDAMDTQLTQPAQQELYLRTPVAYVWDDHDFGGDNSNGESAARPAAAASYRFSVPHYKLPDDDGAIYQSFDVGRVRFIITDTRSQRSPQNAADDAGKTMLGADQKAWFKQQLLEANGRYPLIVWVNPDPWIAGPTVGGDDWGGYTTERRELADFIAANGIKGLVMLSGDAHMLAIDDGTNSGYSASRSAGFPVFHAAPLDKRTSLKGGPYSQGVSLQSGQFGLMTVTDRGSAIDVTWSGRNWRDQEVLRYEFTVPAD
jgi:phosphodiesterase/alkaline phosphatase D-like protein/uncharacterized integral membrane protein